MANHSILSRLSVLTNERIPTMLRSLFDLIETRYLRISTFSDTMDEIRAKIREANYFNDFDPYIDENGNLIIDCLDDADSSLLSIENGCVMLDDDGSASYEAFSRMKFYIDANGDLICEQIPDRNVV